MYLVKIRDQNGSKTITLPSLLCRAAGLKQTDKLILQARQDGTIVIYPEPLFAELFTRLRKEHNIYD